MKLETKAARQVEIENAAYELLCEHGYRGTSMLAIAKRAGASNGTLYKWYGTKQALFSALVRQNAETVATVIERSLENDLSPLQALEQAGTELLLMLTGERAVTLNRAAAGDFYGSGELGRTLQTEGRERIAPLVGRLFVQAINAGDVTGTPTDISRVFFGLLIGDCQIRRVIGAADPFTREEAAQRAAFALQSTLKIYPPTLED